MKEFATEDIENIPNGIYSVKRGSSDGVYVMLKMPEEASAKCFGGSIQRVMSPSQ